MPKIDPLRTIMSHHLQQNVVPKFRKAIAIAELHMFAAAGGAETPPRRSGVLKSIMDMGI